MENKNTATLALTKRNKELLDKFGGSSNKKYNGVRVWGGLCGAHLTSRDSGVGVMLE